MQLMDMWEFGATKSWRPPNKLFGLEIRSFWRIFRTQVTALFQSQTTLHDITLVTFPFMICRYPLFEKKLFGLLVEIPLDYTPISHWSWLISIIQITTSSHYCIGYARFAYATPLLSPHLTIPMIDTYPIISPSSPYLNHHPKDQVTYNTTLVALRKAGLSRQALRASDKLVKPNGADAYTYCCLKGDLVGHVPNGW